MQTRRFIAGVACAAGMSSGWSVQIVSGAEIGLDFANGLDRTPLADSNYGWSFSLATPIIIDGLGFWDAGSDGLVESHPVGLWRTSGPIGVPVLIASTTVSNASLPVSSMSATGRWLFSSVPPVTLDAGSYIVGALYNGGQQKPHDPFVSDALTIVTTPGAALASATSIEPIRPFAIALPRM